MVFVVYIFCNFWEEKSCRYERQAENHLNQLQVEYIFGGRDFTYICIIFRITINFAAIYLTKIRLFLKYETPEMCTFLLHICCIKNVCPLFEIIIWASHSHSTKMEQRKNQEDHNTKNRLNLKCVFVEIHCSWKINQLCYYVQNVYQAAVKSDIHESVTHLDNNDKKWDN